MSRVLLSRSQRHTLKTFQDLRKGDVVFRPKIDYWKHVACKIKNKYSEYSMDYGGYEFEFKHHTLEILDENFKATGKTYEYLYDGCGHYGNSHHKKFNLETKILKDEYEDAGTFEVNDIIAFPFMESGEGYLELTKFYKHDPTKPKEDKHITLWDRKIIWMGNINYWEGILYDDNMKKIDMPHNSDKLEEFDEDNKQVIFDVVIKEE